MKIAIVNRTNLKNYGSLLQSFALCEAVRQLGHESEIIWEDGSLFENYDLRINKIASILLKMLIHPSLIKSTFGEAKTVQSTVISEKTVELFDNFVKENITRKYFKSCKMNKNNVGKMYDKFICGSDQVWCTTTLYVDPLMYLRFAPKNKRIAYAPSLGRDYIPKYNKAIIKKYINDIPYVSVREEKGRELIEELTGKNVLVLLDPTLLLETELWDKLKKENNVEKEYLLCYFLSTPQEKTQNKIIELAKKKSKDIIALNSKLEYVEKECNVIYPDCGPAEFIDFISKAEYVLTDSYHGMLFSIMYHKEFWSIEREYGEFDQSSRQLSVLNMLGLSERYVGPKDQICESVIDYDRVNAVIKRERSKAIDYLKKSIEEE